MVSMHVLSRFLVIPKAPPSKIVCVSIGPLLRKLQLFEATKNVGTRMEWSAWTNPILKIKGTILQILDFILGSL